MIEDGGQLVAVEAADDEEGFVGMAGLDHDGISNPDPQLLNRIRRLIDRLHPLPPDPNVNRSPQPTPSP